MPAIQRPLISARTAGRTAWSPSAVALAHLGVPRRLVLLHALRRRALAPAAVPRRCQLVGGGGGPLSRLLGLLLGLKDQKGGKGRGGQQAVGSSLGVPRVLPRGGGGGQAPGGGPPSGLGRAPSPSLSTLAPACWSLSTLEWALKAAPLAEDDMALL